MGTACLQPQLQLLSPVASNTHAPCKTSARSAPDSTPHGSRRRDQDTVSKGHGIKTPSHNVQHKRPKDCWGPLGWIRQRLLYKGHVRTCPTQTTQGLLGTAWLDPPTPSLQGAPSYTPSIHPSIHHHTSIINPSSIHPSTVTWDLKESFFLSFASARRTLKS